MVVLIVGADRLGNIHEQLSHEGAEEIIHWSGRCKTCIKRVIPKRVKKIIVFCDYIIHPLMGALKSKPKKKGYR